MPSVETAALGEGVEKSKAFPTPSPRAWKTLHEKHCEFPTVPTASAAARNYLLEKLSSRKLRPILSSGDYGKLSTQKRSEFPTVTHAKTEWLETLFRGHF
jgi:hypothetical protein